jgi:hypothetical protein
MVVGCGRANGSGTEAVDASVDAYRRVEDGEKGVEAIGRLWDELRTVARSLGESPWSYRVCCGVWGVGGEVEVTYKIAPEITRKGS